MGGELAARRALPKQVVDIVTERTGGVPLFVEEVTRLLLERGEKDGIHVIPPSLQHRELMAQDNKFQQEVKALAEPRPQCRKPSKDPSRHGL